MEAGSYDVGMAVPTHIQKQQAGDVVRSRVADARLKSAIAFTQINCHIGTQSSVDHEIGVTVSVEVAGKNLGGTAVIEQGCFNDKGPAFVSGQNEYKAVGDVRDHPIRGSIAARVRDSQ